MKNFTNNFKQFTSRLSARWLIMALMLLLGTSSAWAAQFETNGTALSIKLNTSNDNYNYGLSGHGVTELNVVSGPIHIKETYIHVDKSIGGDFCGAELRIKDGDGDREVGDFKWQSNDNNSRQTWKWSGDFEVKPITEGNHTFQIYVIGNFCNEDKNLSNGGSNYSFSYTIEATDPCATTYYLKHEGWSNGNWGWSDAMTCNDGIYTLEAKYNGSGCNYNTKKDDNGAGWIPELNNPNDIKSGTLCIFTFDPSGQSITITPKCTTAAAPSISIGKESICSGESTNITIDGYSDANNYTLYKGNNAVKNPTFNNGVFTVSEAGTYYVTSTPKEGDCTLESAKQATGLTLSVTTDIKFDATEYTTTPWVPVTVVIEVPSGYEFTYNDATLTSITPEADKPIKKENGHEYTYTFPRPTGWGIGNSQSGDGYDEKTYTITATIKNAEQCGTAAATVKLQDEGNDNCTLP